MAGVKGKSGGRRANQNGRPRKKITEFKRSIFAEILAGHDLKALWNGFLTCNDFKIRLDATKYLSDQAIGRAPQSLELTGLAGGPIKFTIHGIAGAEWLSKNEK
jgi:hypothetical protein